MLKVLVNKHWRVLAVVIVAAMAVGLYRAKTEADAARTRVEALESRAGELATTVEALEAEAQSLGSPARVEDLARRELDMRPAAPGDTIAPEDLSRIAPLEGETPPR